MNTVHSNEPEYPEPEAQPEPEPTPESTPDPSPDPTPQPEPAPIPADTPQPPEPLSPQDERLWASLAHLSVLLNLFTGFGGGIAALIIYLVYRDRSRYVAYQSLQALLFQSVFFFGAGALIGVIWAIVGALSLILIGVVLIPFALLATVVLIIMPLIALIYGVIGGIECNNGEDFRYWLIGDWALNMMA